MAMFCVRRAITAGDSILASLIEFPMAPTFTCAIPFFHLISSGLVLFNLMLCMSCNVPCRVL